MHGSASLFSIAGPDVCQASWVPSLWSLLLSVLVGKEADFDIGRGWSVLSTNPILSVVGWGKVVVIPVPGWQCHHTFDGIQWILLFTYSPGPENIQHGGVGDLQPLEVTIQPRSRHRLREGGVDFLPPAESPRFHLALGPEFIW
jgi:hypothetical protein